MSPCDPRADRSGESRREVKRRPRLPSELSPSQAGLAFPNNQTCPGPLGGAIGGLFGIALGEHVAGLIGEYAKKFGEKAGEKLLDTGTDSLTEKLKEPSTGREGVYREALRLSLKEIHTRAPYDGFDDWFGIVL